MPFSKDTEFIIKESLENNRTKALLQKQEKAIKVAKNANTISIVAIIFSIIAIIVSVISI